MRTYLLISGPSTSVPHCPHRLSPTNPSAARGRRNAIRPAPSPEPNSRVTIRIIRAYRMGCCVILLYYSPRGDFYCFQPVHSAGGHPHASGRPVSVVLWRREQTILVCPRHENSLLTATLFGIHPKSLGASPRRRTDSQINEFRSFQSKCAGEWGTPDDCVRSADDFVVAAAAAAAAASGLVY